MKSVPRLKFKVIINSLAAMDISNIAFNKHSYLDQCTKIDRNNREGSKTTFKRNSDDIYEL